MAKITVEKDFGEWKVPSSWDDLTLGKFQELERLYDGDEERKFDVRDVLDLMTDRTKDEINELPIEFTDSLLRKMYWLHEQPDFGKPSNKITIDGVQYTVHNENEMKFGEYVALDTALKGDKHNYASMLAILCRKDGEIFDAKFENEILPSRIEFWKNVSVMKVMPIVSFFLELSSMSLQVSQLSLEIQEGINHILKHIETSKQNGVFSALYTKWQVRKLKKLQKSIKNI
jgi:hypothetical protein